MNVKVRQQNIDVLKCISAFLIVCIHSPVPGEIGKYIIAIARIAVPIFFIITGFFYEEIIRKGQEVSQIKKMFFLTVKAYTIYLLWVIIYACIIKKNVVDYLKMIFTKDSLKNFLMFNIMPLSGHLWYLGAAIYVLIFIFIFRKLKCLNLLYFITPILLIVDLVFGKYSLFLWDRVFPFIWFRNFLFVGIPYFCIGNYIYKKKENIIKNHILMKSLWLLVIIFILLSMAERYILIPYTVEGLREHYISTTFLAVICFIFSLSCENKSCFFTRVFAKIGERYSTWIFILHPITITILEIIIRHTTLYSLYRWVAPLVIYSLSIGVAIIFNKIRSCCITN